MGKAKRLRKAKMKRRKLRIRLHNMDLLTFVKRLLASHGIKLFPWQEEIIKNPERHYPGFTSWRHILKRSIFNYHGFYDQGEGHDLDH